MTHKLSVPNPLTVGLFAVSGLTMFLSWGALSDVALALQMPAERAFLFPLVIDLPTLLAQFFLIRLGAGKRKRAYVYPYALLVLFGAATVGGNMLKVSTLDLDALPVPLWVAVAWYSVPAVANLLITHIAVASIRRSQEPAAELRAADAPVAAAAPAVASKLRTAAPAAPRLREDPERERKRREVLALAGTAPQGEIAATVGVPKSTVQRWLATPQGATA